MPQDSVNEEVLVFVIGAWVTKVLNVGDAVSLLELLLFCFALCVICCVHV